MYRLWLGRGCQEAIVKEDERLNFECIHIEDTLKTVANPKNNTEKKPKDTDSVNKATIITYLLS